MNSFMPALIRKKGFGVRSLAMRSVDLVSWHDKIKIMEQERLENSQGLRSEVQGISNVDVTERLDHNRKDLVEFLARELKNNRGESILNSAGWIPILEDADVLPHVDKNIPNPYDVGKAEELHRAWWNEHPEEIENYQERLRQAKEIMNYIHIGMLIGKIDNATMTYWHSHIDDEIVSSGKKEDLVGGGEIEE